MALELAEDFARAEYNDAMKNKVDMSKVILTLWKIERRRTKEAMDFMYNLKLVNVEFERGLKKFKQTIRRYNEGSCT